MLANGNGIEVVMLFGIQCDFFLRIMHYQSPRSLDAGTSFGSGLDMFSVQHFKN